MPLIVPRVPSQCCLAGPQRRGPGPVGSNLKLHQPETLGPSVTLAVITHNLLNLHLVVIPLDGISTLLCVQIIVRTLSGKAVLVPFDDVRTIADLKSKAQELLSAASPGAALLTPDDVCLATRGSKLEDGRLLSDYGIRASDTVVLLRKPGKRCGLFVKVGQSMTVLQRFGLWQLQFE